MGPFSMPDRQPFEMVAGDVAISGRPGEQSTRSGQALVHRFHAESIRRFHLEHGIQGFVAKERILFHVSGHLLQDLFVLSCRGGINVLAVDVPHDVEQQIKNGLIFLGCFWIPGPAPSALFTIGTDKRLQGGTSLPVGGHSCPAASVMGGRRTSRHIDHAVEQFELFVGFGRIQLDALDGDGAVHVGQILGDL